MTALSLALVACCALVCGTVLALRHVDQRQQAATAVEEAVDAVAAVNERQGTELADLRQRVEVLSAQVALRSM